MSWRELALGDVITLQRGFDITKAQQSAGPFPVVSSSGVNSHHSEFKCNGPGVIIGRKGTLGTVFFQEGAYWPHDTSLWVKDFKGNDQRFCYYLLKSMGLEKYDVGSSNPTLNRNHLHLLETRAPSPEIQRRIAHILSAYDDLIENNTRRISILEDMAGRLFEEWFVRFHFPGGGGELPKDWGIGKLGDVAALTGKSLTPNRQPDQLFAHFSLPNFDTSALPVIEAGALIMSNKLHFAEPVTLLSKLNPRIPRIWPLPRLPNYPAICSTEFLPLAPREGFGLSWLTETLRSEAFLDRLKALAGGTSTSHQRARPADVLQLEIVIPTIDVVQMGEFYLAPMLEMATSLKSASANLRTTRDLLLPKLISGEVEVRAAEEALETAAA